MNILMVTSFPFPGVTGSPIHTMQIARGLAERGHEIVVAKYSGSGGARSSSTWEGIEVRHLPRRDWLRDFAELTVSRRPDVCYAHGDLAVITAFPITRPRRLPMIHEVHSLPADPGDRRGGAQAARDFLARRLAPHLDLQIVLSQRVAWELEGRQAVARGGYRVCYPPADLAAFRAEPRPPRTDAPVIAYAGNFFSYQGVDLLVAAAERVWARRPDVKFRIIGGTRDEALSAFSGMPASNDGRIQFVGRQSLEAMPAFLQDADVLVIPRPDVAENRTTSRKLGEYLAAGRIVVVTDVADHRLIFEPHQCGIVVEPSVEGIARGLLDAVSDPESASRTAARAVRAAEELFCLDRGVEAREAMLSDVVRRSKRR